MAPECIVDGIYSTRTDVWSFGVVLWEIFSFGATPYNRLDNFEVIDFIVQGNRLKAPDACTEDLQTAISQCFQTESGDRPSFAELHALLQVINKEGSRVVLGQNQQAIL